MTLNQIKSVLVNFFESHAQINTVIYSNELDFKAISGVNYPIAHIELKDSQNNATTLVTSYKITIADILNLHIHNRNEDEIFNDTLLIAQDTIDFFSDDDSLFEISENVSLQRFTELNTDRIAGVVFILNVITYRNKNICAIPRKRNQTAGEYFDEYEFDKIYFQD